MLRKIQSAWKFTAFAALVTLAAALMIGLAAARQKPDRVLLPVKTGTPPQGSAGGNWRLLEPVSYENLLVFPVVATTGNDTSGYITLEEALASGDVVVAEGGSEIIRRSRDGRPIRVPVGSAQVNQLVLVNRGSKPLILLAGEVVTGGKQDRVIGKDRIVAPGAPPLPLDVFCVEHGRWTGASAQFSASTVIVHPSVREKAAVDKKQDQVWDAVRSGSTSDAAKAPSLAGKAPRITRRELDGVVATEAQSESYAKIYKSSRVSQSVESFAEEVSRRFVRATSGLKGERVIGVVVAYGGEVAWSDTFASGPLFDRYWPKLLRSYVVEALARPQTREHASLDDARQFMQPLVGRENIEMEPGVYRWREISQGRYAQIELDALPKGFTLHRVKIHRTS